MRKFVTHAAAGRVIIWTGVAASVALAIFVDKLHRLEQSLLTGAILLLLAFHLAVGYAIEENKPWARPVGIGWGILNLLGPLSIVGAYVIWCLSRNNKARC